ncbi:hypothetical protein ABT187_22040 [Streptomyces sp. NPDC001817]|uniref:hypothetical protein n=1 Tax=Streptomyces sp. NPDC001817 TaxID=3154398 RepID=UPI00332CD384
MTASSSSRDVTVAMAFARMPSAQSPFARGRLGEPPAYTYYRCMASAYGSVRRWNPDARLVLVTDDPPPEPFAAQLARIGVEILSTPFAHRPPEGYAKVWGASLYHLDAMEALRGRGGVLVFTEPDVLCVRPLDDLVASVGDAVGAQRERLEDCAKPGTRKLDGYWELCSAMHLELGEPTADHEYFNASVYVIPERWAPVLCERIDKAWQLSMTRHERGEQGFFQDEHFMNYALRGAPVREMSSHVRIVPTAPYRRYLTDRDTILGLTLWNLPYEKDLGFQRMYRDAVDPRSWFWTSPPQEFRRRAGAMLSATRRSPQRALLNVCGDIVERLTTERMQGRLRPVYTRMVQLAASLRPR